MEQAKQPAAAERPAELKIANESGYPLQIAVAHAVNETSDEHGWTVRYTEHSWANASDGQDGFIDLVLQDRHGTAFIVVECKRKRGGTWLFMNTKGVANERSYAKSWVMRYAEGTMKFFGWHDCPVEPRCPEVMFCAVQGQGANEKNVMLERVGGELVSATAALAMEERDFRPPNRETTRFYFNVIVTTAELKVAKFNPADISLADGDLSAAEIVDVPFVRLRKQLSVRTSPIAPDEYASNTKVPDGSKEHTVFIVRAAALVDFLKEFEIPGKSVRQFV